MHARKLRIYNLIFTTVAFLMIMIAIIIAVAFNKRQQTFFSEAQNFAKRSAITVSSHTARPGAKAAIFVYADRPTEQDWIGLFSLRDGKATDSLVKQYLSGCSLQPEGTVRIGYCIFSVPDKEGEYVFRLFRDSLFITATSQITVTEAAQQSPAVACAPRPPCLQDVPACEIITPANGWCPVKN